MMTKLKTKCASKHDMTEVANIFGVNPRTLRDHLKASGNSEMTYSNIYNDSKMCFFCPKAPLPQISEKNQAT